MRRGGTLHPPRPRAPAATRQAPPFLPSEGQVLHIVSCDFNDQASRSFRGENLWKRGEQQQTLPWDKPSLGCRGKLRETSRSRRKKPQPLVEVVSLTI